jgi:hypothetical protein
MDDLSPALENREDSNPRQQRRDFLKSAAGAAGVAFLAACRDRSPLVDPTLDPFVPVTKGGVPVKIRPVVAASEGVPTLEGAGVHLRRVFGFREPSRFDPFLLLDDFRSDHPDRYRPGFPWHPHRGIETITYVLTGDVEHGDSLGNKGVIGAGDVQWMTAGSGIIHQEMPKGDSQGRMYGFQLWANLPARDKMCDPKYRDVRAEDIPEVALTGGIRVKVVAGEVGGIRGPVQDVAVQPEYLDVTIPSGAAFEHSIPDEHTAFAYVFQGAAAFGPRGGGEETFHADGTLVQLGDGDLVAARAGVDGTRFLLVSGRPLGEPIAWRGPIVMNTEAELQQAFDEVRNGTFLRKIVP